jgi:hypothetical protein
MVRRTPRGWERYSPFSAVPEMVFATLDTRLEDGTPAFWVGSANALHCFAHGRWSSFTSQSSPLPQDWLVSLLAVPAGRGTELWVGTMRGLLRYAAGRWTIFHAGSSGLPGDQVRSLLATPRRAGAPVLWAGTDHGVGRFAGEAWEKAPIPCLPHAPVLALHSELGRDGGGWLWIGTQAGLARLRIDGEGRPLKAPQDCQSLAAPRLVHPLITQIQTDAWGRIYLFTDAGVSRLTLAPGSRLETARVETFDTGDGLPGMEFNRTAFSDALGRIWAGANGGAAILDPAPPRTTLPPPAALRLVRILVSGRERAFPPGTTLRHDENNIDLQYALLSYRREAATRYRTQLVGLEDRPSAWTPEARAVYHRLPRGDYTFRVWGRDGEGTVSGPLEVRFGVRPAPWLSAWAIALYALSLIGLGYGASHVRASPGGPRRSRPRSPNAPASWPRPTAVSRSPR